jgi:hypothetical protein
LQADLVHCDFGRDAIRAPQQQQDRAADQHRGVQCDTGMEMGGWKLEIGREQRFQLLISNLQPLLKFVAMSTTDLGIFRLDAVFPARGFHLHLLYETEERSADACAEREMRARVREQNIRHGARLAQCRLPRFGRWILLNQATFFHRSSAIIIAIEKFAFFAERCFHFRHNLAKVLPSIWP